jgi:hypothetical protein
VQVWIIFQALASDLEIRRLLSRRFEKGSEITSKNYGKADAITEAIVERYAPDVVAAIFGKTDKEQRRIVPHL